jgi:uncharacterized membrane protein YhhN
MGPRLFLHLYTIASMVEIFARTSGRDDLEMIVKPLLMPLLIIWFVRSAAIISPLERWTIIALIFSWGGDVFLLFADKAEYWFMAGLGSFLVGHLCYIQAFRQGPFLPAKTTFGEQAPPRGLRTILWATLPVLGFAGLLIWNILPGLGDMMIPVLVYASVISAMALAALNRYRKVPTYSFSLVSTGALVFVLSDSMIAWNRFHTPFESAGTLIMLTYIAAQLLITTGILAQRSKMTGENPLEAEPALGISG